MQITDDILLRAERSWNHFPYRRCWVALKEGEEPVIILKATAHTAGSMARKGWTVRELKRV